MAAGRVAVATPTDLTINRNATNGTVSATVIIRGLNCSITSPNAVVLTLDAGNHGNSFFQDDVTFLTGTDKGKDTLNPGDRKIRDATHFFTNAAANLPATIAVTHKTPLPFTGAVRVQCV